MKKYEKVYSFNVIAKSQKTQRYLLLTAHIMTVRTQ